MQQLQDNTATGLLNIDIITSAKSRSFMAMTLLICIFNYGFSWKLIIAWALMEIMKTVMISDLEDRIISNRCVLGATVLCVIKWLFTESGTLKADLLAGSLAAGIFAAGLFALSAMSAALLTGRKAAGGGDIKLMAACGMLLGFNRILYIVCSSCILGLFAYIISAHRYHSRYFPFGPCIALASVFSVLCL